MSFMPITFYLLDWYLHFVTFSTFTKKEENFYEEKCDFWILWTGFNTEKKSTSVALRVAKFMSIKHAHSTKCSWGSRGCCKSPSESLAEPWWQIFFGFLTSTKQKTSNIVSMSIHCRTDVKKHWNNTVCLQD